MKARRNPRVSLVWQCRLYTCSLYVALLVPVAKAGSLMCLPPQGFGMRIENRQMEVGARVLTNPRLAYGAPANFDPKVQRREGGHCCAVCLCICLGCTIKDHGEVGL
jgi:hypothetical protein